MAGMPLQFARQMEGSTKNTSYCGFFDQTIGSPLHVPLKLLACDFRYSDLPCSHVHGLTGDAAGAESRAKIVCPKP